MKKLLTIFRDLHDDKSGAAFIEYTVLLGVILAASIAVITIIGTWAAGVWTNLCTEVGGVGCVPVVP